MMMRLANTTSFVIGSVLLLSAMVAGESLVTLQTVDGGVDTNKVLANWPVTFFLTVENNSGETIEGVTNGFRLYSPDDINWIPAYYIDSAFGVIDTTYYGAWVEQENSATCWGQNCGSSPFRIFDELWVETQSDDDSNPNTPHKYGEGVDTIGFAAIAYEGGMPPGLSKLAWSIQVFQFFPEDTGKLICLDSSSFRFNQTLQTWVWGVDGSPEVVHPLWQGAYCFTITNKCCWGMRGNVNRDWQDQIDISDLTALVGWMFKSGSAPPCMLEADVDGNGGHDVADVTYLVAYMFRSGPEPAGCP